MTRWVEAPWGADPLEYHGGFRNLTHDTKKRYPSSVAREGLVGWTNLEAQYSKNYTDGRVATSLHISFPHVQWQDLQAVYGWPALQWQGWARGEIIVADEEEVIVLLYTDSILEFWVDDQHYFGGDFYSFRKAPPVLHLKPGTHRLDLRLVRDVRAFGGVGAPKLLIDLELWPIAHDEPSVSANSDFDGPLVSDIVDSTGRPASPLSRVSFRNNGKSPVMLESATTVEDGPRVMLLTSEPFVLAPGQTRPLAMNILLQCQDSDTFPGNRIVTPLVFQFRTMIESGKSASIIVEVPHNIRSITEPHKVTHLHPGGIVSYSMLKAPPKKCSDQPENEKLPVLLGLHGAGLEAENDAVAHIFDRLPDLCAWIVLPTGVTPWSGDDWHTWGWADVETAIQSIPHWIRATGWNGANVDIERWLVSGHSNGGQGTRYALTHRPDNIIAAAPVSGYLSIEQYVPYQFWHPMSSYRKAVLEAATASYRHEMLADNARGIPVLQQHGSADDNVPPYHSRLWHQLLREADVQSSYNEIADSPHYFDGVMTTPSLAKFFHTHLASNTPASRSLDKFRIVVANPGDMGPKGGVLVMELDMPAQYGFVDVEIVQCDAETCVYTIKTSNVRWIRISPRSCAPFKLEVDDQVVDIPTSRQAEDDSINLHQETQKRWAVDLSGSQRKIHNDDHEEEEDKHGNGEELSKSVTIRKGRQLGALDAILRTQGRFTIRHTDEHKTESIAVQVSRNLYQYFSVDAAIGADVESDDPGNLITLAHGRDFPTSDSERFPIEVTEGMRVTLRDSDGQMWTYKAKDGLALITLRPLKDVKPDDERLWDERLELFVWGSDVESLAMAARLVPTLTGVSQPDFIVLDKGAAWKGAEGALAMGFFDSDWKVSRNSFLT